MITGGSNTLSVRVDHPHYVKVFGFGNIKQYPKQLGMYLKGSKMIELLLQRKAQLKELYKKSPDIELVYRLREVELMIKRYKKQIEAEVDAAGFREELGNLVVLMTGLEAV